MGGDPGRLEKLTLSRFEKAGADAKSRVGQAKTNGDVDAAWVDLARAAQKLGEDLPKARAQDRLEAERKAEAARQAEANKPTNQDLSRPTKTPTAAQIAEIDDAIKRRAYQQALDKAARYYGIDLGNVTALKYDATYTEAAAYTNNKGVIRVGPQVFNHRDSGAPLTASTIVHEVTHANQVKHHGHPNDRRDAGNDRYGQGMAAYEWMGYRAEYESAGRVGLPTPAREDVKTRMDANWASLSDENQKRMGAGTYWDTKN